ncbi:hypothetical protein C2W62_39330 [Candidatus Entotheonella serta]|nr:hypothetical protein C2W62_39330 [Candidatus Entotheonella serta]
MQVIENYSKDMIRAMTEYARTLDREMTDEEEYRFMVDYESRWADTRNFRDSSVPYQIRHLLTVRDKNLTH